MISQTQHIDISTTSNLRREAISASSVCRDLEELDYKFVIQAFSLPHCVYASLHITPSFNGTIPECLISTESCIESAKRLLPGERLSFRCWTHTGSKRLESRRFSFQAGAQKHYVRSRIGTIHLVQGRRQRIAAHQRSDAHLGISNMCEVVNCADAQFAPT